MGEGKDRARERLEDERDEENAKWRALWRRPMICDKCNGTGEITHPEGGPQYECSDCAPRQSNINECPSCKRMFENGGQCAAPVMRGGCPMGGDV